MKTLAIVLIVFGAVMLAVRGFNYFTTEKVVDIGHVQINRDVNHWVQWSPVAGLILLVGGIVVYAIDKNRVIK